MSGPVKVATITAGPGLSSGTVMYRIDYTEGGQGTARSYARPEDLAEWRTDLAAQGWTVVDASGGEQADASPADRILAAVAQALTDLNDIRHGRVIMAAAVLAHQQPELTASEAVETAANDTTGEHAHTAWAEGCRLLDAAAEIAAEQAEGGGNRG